MKKLVAFFKNQDLLNRLLFTLAIFLVFRVGSAITVPGVNIKEDILSDTSSSFSLLNMMGWGTLQNFSNLALGVSTFITAQIIIELLSMDALPALAQMNKEGDSGRKKMTMVLRILAVFLSAVQGYGIIVTLKWRNYFRWWFTLGLYKIIVLLEQCFLFSLVIKSLIKELVTVYQLLLLEELLLNFQHKLLILLETSLVIKFNQVIQLWYYKAQFKLLFIYLYSS